MWTCPDCNQKFVNTNQWHSCNQNTVDKFLEGHSPDIIRIYDRLISTFQEIGDFELHPAKTRIALNKRMRFASINRLGNTCLYGHLVFNQPYLDTLCFHRVEEVTKSAYVHHFKLYSTDDITEELIGYMNKAYHLGS